MNNGGATRPNPFRERVFPVVFMCVLTALFIAMVSGIYLATRESVLRNELLYLRRAVLFAAGVPVPGSAVEIERRYLDRVREVAGGGGEDASVAYYEIVDTAGATTGYVIPADGPGLWGEIEAVVGFERDLRTLTGVDFIKQNETPGLGGRITEVWFREQFRGKSGPFSRVPEGTDGEAPDEFDAITGATITSTAVQEILNRIQAEAPSIVQGGK